MSSWGDFYADDAREEPGGDWGDPPGAAPAVHPEEKEEEQHPMPIKREEGEEEENMSKDSSAAKSRPVPDAAYHEEENDEEDDAPAPTNNSADDDDDGYSGVDGIGMWRSWSHNYETPRGACLDLLDNCFDATLTEGNTQFEGKVSLEFLAPNGLVITNNSSKAIKPLRETLTAYRSQKNTALEESQEEVMEVTTKDVIGEYGVGLKQACATLSDCCFVLTKTTTKGEESTTTEFQLGVIAKSLQTRDSVNLPHFAFCVETDTFTTREEEEQQIHHQITKIFKEYPFVSNLITNTLGRGNRKTGVLKLVQQYYRFLTQEWSHHPHVFQLLITKLIHTGQQQVARNASGIPMKPAVQFLEEIRQILPKHYINIPLRNFQFTIQKVPVKFCYWQNRLVEMTKFEVNIPKDYLIQRLPDNGPWAQTGYPLSIYCGFDALRLKDKSQSNTCQLCIYSRKAGRLIEVNTDARDILVMNKAGINFSQGLTVIIDDVAGELPLKPTKDGLTWSKESKDGCSRGQIHKANLMVWTGTIAKMYWNYHHQLFLDRVKESKSKLSNTIQSFVPAIQKRLDQLEASSTLNTADPTLEKMEDGKFCMFSDIPWKKREDSNSLKVVIFKGPQTKLTLWRENTPATLWKIKKEQYEPTEDEEPAPSKKTPNKKTPASSAKKRGRPRSTGRSSYSAGSTSRKKQRGSSFSMGRTSPLPLPMARAASHSTASAANDCSSSSGEEEEEVGERLTSPAVAKEMVTPSIARRIAFPSPQAGVEQLSTKGLLSVSNTNRLKLRGKEPRHSRNNTNNLPSIAEESPKVKELEQALQNSQSRVQELQNDLNQAKRHLLMSPQQPHQSPAETNALQSLKQAQKENAALKQQCEQLKASQTTAQQAKQENDLLRQHYRQLKLGLQEKEHSLQIATQEKTFLGQEKQRLESQLSQLPQLQQSLQVAQQEKAQLQQQLERQSNAKDHETRKMQLQIQTLQLELEQRDKTIGQLSGGNGFHWGQGTDQI